MTGTFFGAFNAVRRRSAGEKRAHSTDFACRSFHSALEHKRLMTYKN